MRPAAPMRYVQRVSNNYLIAAGVLLFASVNSTMAGPTPYPLPPGDGPCVAYQLLVDGVEVPCVQTSMGVGYAHFAFQGAVRVEVRVAEAIKTFDLSPHRLNLAANPDGNVLSFVMEKPSKLHLRINNLMRFFIFADGEETGVPVPGNEGVHLLTDMGVTSSPDTVQTTEIQAAFDRVAAARGTLLVPPGIYKAGMLSLPSNLSLYLAPGSIIKGTGNPADYPAKGERTQFLMADATNVRVWGRGVLDNNGLALRQVLGGSKGSTRMFVSQRSSGLIMEDVILRDSAVWCIHPVESSDMRFTNLKIISMTRAESSPDLGYNTDAFDPDNSSNMVMEKNFISVDDDAIAVKLTRGTRRDMSGIVFRDNVIFNMCAALKIGTEVRGGFTVRDVLFENNDVVHADIGIALYCYKGGHADNIRWIGNHFEKIATIPDNSPHHHFCNIYLTTNGPDDIGRATNLLLKDNSFENFGPQTSRIRANGKDRIIDKVSIQNLTIGGRRRTSLADARIEAEPEVGAIEFE